jgi:ubiquinone/menaquinone biosynthesis C-methylase UbiE
MHAQGSSMSDGATQEPARVDQRDIPGLYDRLSRIYDLWAALTESRARRRALQRAAPVDGESILEIAVGTGQQFVQLVGANTHGTTRGVDLSPQMLARARTRIAQLPGTAQLEVADAHTLPFPDRTFDLVLVSYLFDLLPESDFSAIIAEIRRVLRDNGRVIVVNMTIGEKRRDNLYRWIYRLSPKLLGGCRGVRLTPYLVACGFRVVQRDYVTQLGFPSEILTNAIDDAAPRT